jgi:hypothetical protein
MYKIMCLCGDYWIEYASTGYEAQADDIAAIYRSRGLTTRIDIERPQVTLGLVVEPNPKNQTGGTK